MKRSKLIAISFLVFSATRSGADSSFDHLLDGNFQSFVSDRGIVKKPSPLKAADFYALLAQTDQLIASFSKLSSRKIDPGNPVCEVKSRSLAELERQIAEWRLLLIRGCTPPAASLTCSVFEDQWSSLGLSARALLGEFVETCLARSHQDVSLENWEPGSFAAQPKGIEFRLGASAQRERFTENGSAHDSASETSLPALSLRSEVFVPGDNFEVFGSTRLDIEKLEPLPVANWRAVYFGKAGGLDMQLRQLVKSQRGHFISDSDDVRSMSSFEGDYALGMSSDSTDFWRVHYQPNLVVSSLNAYSFLRQGGAFEWGRSTLQGQQASFYRLGFDKSFPATGSLLPGVQRISLERVYKGLSEGNSFFELSFGVSEVRDSANAVRLMPLFHFTFMEPKASGLLKNSKNSEQLEKYEHASKLEARWHSQSNFYSAAVQTLEVSGQYALRIDVRQSAKIFAGYAYSENISTNISGDLQCSDFWQGFSYFRKFGKNLEATVTVKLQQRLMSDPDQDFNPDAWIRPMSSGRGTYAEVGFLYAF